MGFISLCSSYLAAFKTICFTPLNLASLPHFCNWNFSRRRYAFQLDRFRKQCASRSLSHARAAVLVSGAAVLQMVSPILANVEMACISRTNAFRPLIQVRWLRGPLRIYRRFGPPLL